MAVLLVLALLVLAPLAPRALVSRPMLRPVSRPRLRAPQWAPQWAPLLIRSSCGVRALRATLVIALVAIAHQHAIFVNISGEIVKGRGTAQKLDTGLPFAWPTVIRDVIAELTRGLYLRRSKPP